MYSLPYLLPGLFKLLKTTMRICDTISITDLDHGDDVALLTTSFEEMLNKIDAVERHARSIGLVIDTPKTITRRPKQPTSDKW